MSGPPPNDSRPLPPRPLSTEVIPPPSAATQEALKESLDFSTARCSSLEGEVEARGKRLRELEAALQRSHADLKRLNTIIFKGAAPNSGPSDDYFRIELCSIRDSILKIVRCYYQATKVSLQHLSTDEPQLSERQREWLGNWNRDSPEIRNYRAQGAIFYVLHSCLFSKPVFAIDKALTKHLREFELDMEKCAESK